MKYYVHYISFNDSVLDWSEFTTLEKAMKDALYWLEVKRIIIKRIEIFKTCYAEESFYHEPIAIINA
jgi:hypothetical protein